MERSDYKKALPALQTYFSLIRNTGNRDFDVARTATLELEWWIVHRQRERYSPGALASACAKSRGIAVHGVRNSTLEHGCALDQGRRLLVSRVDIVQLAIAHINVGKIARLPRFETAEKEKNVYFLLFRA
jgi:hypothetical protein